MNRLPDTRHSLLLRLANGGDGDAWAKFLDVYERVIFRFVCSRGLQPADAEDVTQRVLEAVFEKARQWEPGASRGSFGAWLFRVARNLSAKVWNERIHRDVACRGSGDEVRRLQTPELSEEDKTIFHLEYRRALFRWAADRVRVHVERCTWEAFWRTAVDGLDPDRVANDLGLSLSSVYAAKCRILARIRTEIDCFENDFSILREQKSS